MAKVISTQRFSFANETTEQLKQRTPTRLRALRSGLMCKKNGAKKKILPTK